MKPGDLVKIQMVWSDKQAEWQEADVFGLVFSTIDDELGETYNGSNRMFRLFIDGRLDDVYYYENELEVINESR